MLWAKTLPETRAEQTTPGSAIGSATSATTVASYREKGDLFQQTGATPTPEPSEVPRLPGPAGKRKDPAPLETSPGEARDLSAVSRERRGHGPLSSLGRRVRQPVGLIRQWGRKEGRRCARCCPTSGT